MTSQNENRMNIGVLICLLIAFAPLMFFHFQGLWAEEYYQYYPFVIGAVAWFMFDRWRYAEPTCESKVRNSLFWLLSVGGFLLLTFATVIWSPWLASFAFVLAMGAVALQIYSQHGRLTNQFGIWCLLWLLVPVPLQFDQRFVVRLQRISAQLSGQVLDLLGIDHLMSGTVLELPDKQLFVDDACSGIVSVMSVIAAGGMYVVWKNRTLLHSIAVMCCGIVWAVAMNIGRITLIAVAHTWWNLDLSEGWPHDVLGLVLFSFTFISLVSTDSLLAFLGEPITKVVADREAPQNRLVHRWNSFVSAFDPNRALVADAAMAGSGAVIAESLPSGKTQATASSKKDDRKQSASVQAKSTDRGMSSRFVMAISALCLVLCGLQVFVLSRGYRDPESPVELAMSIDSALLPDKVGDWEKVAFEPIERESGNEFGNFSKQFSYRHIPTDTTTTVSLDFPYRGGWHELSVCYRNFGWPMAERTVTDVPLGDTSENWKVINADYTKPDGQFGFLAFSGTNGTGDLLEPPSSLVLWRPWFRLRRRLLHRISPRFFQFQAWVTSNSQFSQAEKDDVMKLFLELRPYVLNRLREGS